MAMVMKQFFGFYLALFIVFPTMGQEWAFRQVEKLPASINSAAEETMPLLSPDGKTLYFTRLMSDQNVGGKFAGQDIWASKFDGSKWIKAYNRGQNLNNDKQNNAVIGIGRDGKTLYLLNASSNHKLKGIYFSKNINGKWAEPELIPIEGINPEGFVGFYVSPDFDVILISMKRGDSRGEEDLYVCLKEAGRWLPPKNLGPTINTTGFEISPSLSGDKKKLFFSSNGHQGFGDGDIFYAERLYDSWETWSTPKNLGKEINTKFFEGYFCPFMDSLAFFASNRNSGLSEIFTAKISRPNLIVKTQKKMLSKYELDQAFGRNANMIFTFEKTETELDLPQQEMLFYLASKMSSEPDLKMELVTREENMAALSDLRLQSMATHLKTSGLPSSSFSIAETGAQKKTTQRMVVEIVFYREVTNPPSGD